MSIEEIKNKFPGDAEALAYFEMLRWGAKNKCAYCQSEKISARQIDNRYHCSSCRKTFSVTAGTFLHGSKIPLKSWLYAFAAVSSSTGRFSIKQLQRDIRVSYTTAWQMYQDIKKLLPNNEIEKILANDKFEYLCKKAILVNNEIVAENKPEVKNKLLVALMIISLFLGNVHNVVYGSRVNKAVAGQVKGKGLYTC
jgi:transposase-like protein